MTAKTQKEKSYTALYDWIGVISFACALVVLMFTFVFVRVTVEGSSMENTLKQDDRLIISTLNYDFKNNDIIATYVPKLKKTLVKRVIATGGQTINIDYTSHRVYVDGILTDEPFIKEPTAYMGLKPVSMPITVPEGYVFVMGDNRNDSIDSRSTIVGLVNRKYVIGKALLRYYPYENIKLLN